MQPKILPEFFWNKMYFQKVFLEITLYFCYNYIEWIKGEYILDCSDLCDFVENVALNNDVAKEEREISLHKIHEHIDNNSTNRVIDLLVNKL